MEGSERAADTRIKGVTFSKRVTEEAIYALTATVMAVKKIRWGDAGVEKSETSNKCAADVDILEMEIDWI